MSKKLIITGLIILIILVIIFIIFSLDSKQKIAIDYLNSKYGNGEWKIIAVENYVYRNNSEVLFSQEYIQDGVILTVSSSYLDDNPFHIYVNENNIVTTDCFLPTYYSIKYNVDYKFNITPNEKDDFSELINKMTYISSYHYPYEDYEHTSNGWYFDKPKCLITSFLMESFYDPISVKTSPTKEKVLDIIPNNQRIPELEEIIQLVEEYYSSGRLRNENINDKEFYELLFKKDTDERTIINYISNHITPVHEMEIYFKYNNSTDH